VRTIRHDTASKPLTFRRKLFWQETGSYRILPLKAGKRNSGKPKPMAMTEQRVSYTLDSSLETIDSAEEKATRIATELGFGDDEVMQISMAVREGAVNAVLHGNAYAPDKKVTLAFERTGNELVITIRDQGRGMDLSKIPNPLAPENLLKTSGRGIFLMRSFMDVVEIRPSATGTELKLIKRVHGPTAGGKEASQ
jgi:serine/threonine-protein kinase RsbW